MSIYARTINPRELVSSIKEKISDGLIDSWEIDSDGDFTHKSEQWRYRAWLHPYIEEGRIVFAIWGRKSFNMSVDEYATYHGMFVRMLLKYFDHQVEGIEVTPLASTYDSVKAETDKDDKSE